MTERSYSAALLAIVRVDDHGSVTVDVPLGALTSALEGPIHNIDPDRFAHDIVAVQAAVRRHRPVTMRGRLGRWRFTVQRITP